MTHIEPSQTPLCLCLTLPLSVSVSLSARHLHAGGIIGWSHGGGGSIPRMRTSQCTSHVLTVTMLAAESLSWHKHSNTERSHNGSHVCSHSNYTQWQEGAELSTILFPPCSFQSSGLPSACRSSAGEVFFFLILFEMAVWESLEGDSLALTVCQRKLMLSLGMWAYLNIQSCISGTIYMQFSHKLDWKLNFCQLTKKCVAFFFYL